MLLIIIRLLLSNERRLRIITQSYAMGDFAKRHNRVIKAKQLTKSKNEKEKKHAARLNLA